MSSSQQTGFPVMSSRFEINKLLGEGTIGRTFIATDKLRNQPIVIKILHDDIIADAGGFQNLCSDLNRIASLSHPQIGRLYDFGLSEGNVYLVMELMTGRSLHELLSDSNESDSIEATQLVQQIARILLALEHELPHGGLKPKNIWIDENGKVRLSDYGLARLANSRKRSAAATLLGTAPFLSPESFGSEAVPDLASDSFSLGVLWVELLQRQSTKSHIISSKGIRSLTQALTNPAPTQRRKALQQLADKSERSQKRHTFSLRVTYAAIVLFLLVGLILYPALRSSWTPVPAARKPGTGLSQISVSAYFSRAKQISRKITELQLQANPISELRGILSDQFRSESAIEGLWEAGLSQLEDVNSQGQLAALERDQFASLRRLKDASLTLENWIQTKSIFREIEESEPSTGSPYANELATSAATRRDLYEQIKGGQFRSAAVGSEKLVEQLQVTRRRILTDTFNRATQAKKNWQNALSATALEYIEPYGQPSKRLDDLTSRSTTDDLRELAERSDEITHLYQEWTRSLQSVPQKQADTVENSIGMRFRRCDTLWASIWETRVIDFAYFVKASGSDMRRLWRERAITKGPFHPVVNISPNDAEEFCRWLTQRDRDCGLLIENERYRLPTDLEWSALAGLEEPDDGRPPSDRGWEFPHHFPWGNRQTPNPERGNYFTPFGASKRNNFHGHDPYLETAPVGQFPPNPYGLYDLGGNVWEWVSDGMHLPSTEFTRRDAFARGGGWRSVDLDEMRTETRRILSHDHEEIGFRVLLERAYITEELGKP